MRDKFIKTSDDKTYETLLKNGFTFLHRENGKYVFLNNGKMSFSEDDKRKILFTDILSV